MSQSDKRLLIYGREKEKLVVASKAALRSFSSNRPFSYSKKKSGSNDISLHFVEFSNTHNSDRSIEALTPINRTFCTKMYKNITRSRLFFRIAKGLCQYKVNFQRKGSIIYHRIKIFDKSLKGVLPVLCHECETTCQTDSNKASNSKLRPDLCKFVKIEIIESAAPPQFKGRTVIMDNSEVRQETSH